MTNYAALEDQHLLDALRDGDERAFNEIYHRHWQQLVAIGYYHTRNKQMAEEVVGDVLIGLWHKRHELEIRSLSAYLGTAVKYAVFKVMVRHQRRQDILKTQVDAASEDNETEKKLEARFLREFLDGIVEALPEKTRLVFKYSREDQLSVAEIAGKMDLSPKSVEYHITKALKALKDSIRKFNNIFFS
jgi:RNA polymerase sigma-70 factor (ECF subfamily)